MPGFRQFNSWKQTSGIPHSQKSDLRYYSIQNGAQKGAGQQMPGRPSDSTTMRGVASSSPKKSTNRLVRRPPPGRIADMGSSDDPALPRFSI
jgi:hypothetical protein